MITAVAIVGFQHKDIVSARKNILNYSVIPSLFFASSGHLLFVKKVRAAQGWDDSVGTVTLERELGITQLSMAIIALFSSKDPEYICSLWGLMLCLMGLNHMWTDKKVTAVVIMDIAYGATLLGIYAKELLP
jgi:hypothetical protein